MRVTRLNLIGFGKFVGRQLDLDGGLTVLYGPNESGKSTIQGFLRGMLYGFKTPDARRRSWTADHQRYEPWSGHTYAGALEFTASDGRSYRVERSFSRDKDQVQIFDAVTGRDLSAKFAMDKRRERLFAERFTGMNELVFTSTVCLGAMPDSTTVKGRAELAARLANLQESADEATSVRRATAILESARKQTVTYANQLLKQEGELNQDLQTIMRRRAAQRRLELELRGVSKEQVSLETDEREILSALLGLEILDLERQTVQAAVLQTRLGGLTEELDLLAPYARVPIELLDEARRLQTKLEQGDEELLALRLGLDDLEVAIGSESQGLFSLPGAEGLLMLLADSPSHRDRVRALPQRLQESRGQLQTASVSLREAAESLHEAEEELARYPGLAGFPTDAPHVLAELEGCIREASGLSEHWQTLARRRRSLSGRIHQYEDRARSLLRKLADLELVAALPPDADQQMERLQVEVRALAHNLEDALSAYATWEERANGLEERLKSSEHLAVLPADAETHLQELQVRIRSGQQRVAALRTQVDQLVAMARRHSGLSDICSCLEDALHGDSALSDLSIADIHEGQVWLSRWRSAGEEADRAEVALEEASEAQQSLRRAMANLEALGAAGEGALARAEQLAAQEAEARSRAGKAATAAEALVDPPSGRYWLGGILVAIGLVLGLVGGLIGLPVSWRWAGLLLLVAGTPITLTVGRQRGRVRAERDRWFGSRAEAIANAERLNAELRPLLAQVGKSSVAAWAEAWKRFNQHQAEMVQWQQQAALANTRLAQARKGIAAAVGGLEPLLSVTGKSQGEAPTLQEAEALLAELSRALLARQDQGRQLAAAQVELGELSNQLQATFSVVAEAIRAVIPRAQVPDEPDADWAQAMLQEGIESIQQESEELTTLLDIAQVAEPGQLLKDLRARQALVAEQEAVAKELAIRGDAVQALTAKKTATEDQIAGLLAAAGVGHVEEYYRRLQAYTRWQLELAALPQDLPPLERDAEELLAEVRGGEPTTFGLRGRLEHIFRLLPETGVPVEQVAVALEAAPEIAHLCEDLPQVLWPERLGELLRQLPTAGTLDRRSHAAKQMLSWSQTALEQVLERAHVDDREAFQDLWQEYTQARRTCAEAAQVVELRQDAWQSALNRVHGLLADEVASLLEMAGLSLPELPTTGEIGAEWEAGLQEGLRRFDAVEAAREALQRRQQELQKQQDAVSARELALADLRKALEEVLAQAQTPSVAEFVTACAMHHRWREVTNQLQAHKQQLEALLGSATVEQIESRLQAREQEWTALVGSNRVPDAEADPSERALLEERLHRTRHVLADVRDRIAAIQGEMRSLVVPSEAEERVVADLERIATERLGVEQSLNAWRLAQGELEAASEEVHRQFAPALNARASEVVAHITQGRYGRISVSEALEIYLTDPDFERQIDLNAVSHGTCEQVYLAFRLAAAEAVCGDNWTPPFILDDPFAHYDDVRTREALETILRVSERTQVLFFTCREREVNMVQELSAETGIRCQLLELH